METKYSPNGLFFALTPLDFEDCTLLPVTCMHFTRFASHVPQASSSSILCAPAFVSPFSHEGLRIHARTRVQTPRRPAPFNPVSRALRRRHPSTRAATARVHRTVGRLSTTLKEEKAREGTLGGGRMALAFMVSKQERNLLSTPAVTGAMRE